MLPVTAQLAEAGLYISALAVTTPALHPPTTNTVPFATSVAVRFRRARFMLRVTVHMPVAGS